MVKAMISISPYIWAWFSLIVAVISYTPYTISIFRGRTKPHAFTWVIWAALTTIAFTAQIAEGAGPGAWATGFTALVSFCFVGLALFKGEKDITRSDWITFLSGIAAIPLWYTMDSPLYAVILITVIDALAFYPTFRKSWYKPSEELPITYILSAVKFALALAALQTFNWTTVLYPASLVFMNSIFVVMVTLRRRALSPSPTPA